MLKTKLFIIVAFLAFASFAFLSSGTKTDAQSGKLVKESDKTLDEIAGYKGWKQVQKPVKEPENEKTNEVLAISESSLAG